jgi:hypothetical protein
MVYGTCTDFLAPAEALWRLADGANAMVLLLLPSMCCFHSAVVADKCVVATAAVTTVISASSVAAKLYDTQAISLGSDGRRGVNPIWSLAQLTWM